MGSCRTFSGDSRDCLIFRTDGAHFPPTGAQTSGLLVNIFSAVLRRLTVWRRDCVRVQRRISGRSHSGGARSNCHHVANPLASLIPSCCPRSPSHSTGPVRGERTLMRSGRSGFAPSVRRCIRHRKGFRVWRPYNVLKDKNALINFPTAFLLPLDHQQLLFDIMFWNGPTLGVHARLFSSSSSSSSSASR